MKERRRDCQEEKGKGFAHDWMTERDLPSGWGAGEEWDRSGAY